MSEKYVDDNAYARTVCFWSVVRERAEMVANSHSPPWTVEEFNGGFRVVNPYHSECP